MKRDGGQVMLVGSVARPDDGWGVEDVFRNCVKTLGARVSMLPDGEVGDRYYWINYLARHAYNSHAGLQTVSHHTFEDWKPTGYADHWRFTLAPGAQELHFDRLGYVDEALRSYEVFIGLREQGVVPPGTRFMVALPLIESATRPFIDSAANWEVLWTGYAEAISRELRELCAAVPHDDLAIQWDVCLETAAVEGIQVNFTDEGLQQLPMDPLERCVQAIKTVVPAIADDVWLGLHICYGSLGHEEGTSADTGSFKPMTDLGVSVDMANAGVAAAGRPVQFLHLAVQSARGHLDEFYAPLERLDVGDARVYLGLIHLHDGLEGSVERIRKARGYLREFGVATQCGWGRRPANERIEDLLALNRDVADANASVAGPASENG